MATREARNVSRRVLVVDDNRDAVETLAAVLRLSGHEVHAAYDGRGAIEIALRIRPEFVFLDVALPDMDGFAVAKRLKLEPWHAGMTIIALSGHASEEDRARCVEVGCDHYLVKPVDLRFLESLLGARGRAGPG